MSDPRSRVRAPSEILAAIPAEVLEHDCGCGSAWKWASEGETAVDLGCGSGKTCFLLSSAVGSSGRVIGVDASAAMIDVARRSESVVARAVGWSNVRFVESRIEDLGRGGSSGALVADASVDFAVLDCVMTFVPERVRKGILLEAARVVRPGGQLLVADVLAADLEGLPALLAASGFGRIEVVERDDEVRRVIDGHPRCATTVRAWA